MVDVHQDSKNLNLIQCFRGFMKKKEVKKEVKVVKEKEKMKMKKGC